jgi:hypothetical protein
VRQSGIADFGLRIGRTAIFFVALALSLFTAQLAADAQQGGRVYRLGILRPTAPFSSDDEARIPVALRELGYIEGQNLVVERRYAEGKLDRLPELARELVHARVDVIVAVSAGPSEPQRTPQRRFRLSCGDSSIRWRKGSWRVLRDQEGTSRAP